VRVAATVDQQLRDAVMAVVERHHDRGDAFRRRQVHVRARRGQRLHAGVTTTARGIQQRREPAVRVILPARLRRDLARPVREPGARIHGGALRNQPFHHRRRIARGGSRPHQRRLLLHLLDDVHLCAGVQEHLEDREIAVLDGDHQRRLTVLVGALAAGAGGQQRLHHAGIALPGGLGQRRVAEFVGDIHPRLLRDERRHDVVVDAVDGPVNRPRPVRLRLVDVGARLDHRQRRGAASFLDHAGELARPALRQDRRSRCHQQDRGDENATLHRRLPLQVGLHAVVTIVHTTSGSSLL
jgi:hypothetical protein